MSASIPLASLAPILGGDSGLFFTPSEKEKFSMWKEEVHDKSISTKLMKPLFRFLADRVPEGIAPNVLTVMGMVMMVQAWYLNLQIGAEHPRIVSAFAVICVALYWILHNIDGKYAMRTMQDTPIGELFKYACDSVSMVFLSQIVATVLGANGSYQLQWYVVQTTQLLMMTKHYSAFLREAGVRYWYVGPGEALTTIVWMLIAHSFFGLQFLADLYIHAYTFTRNYIITLGFGTYVPSQKPIEALQDALQFTYMIGFIATLTKVTFGRSQARHRHTRVSMLTCLWCRVIPAAWRFISPAEHMQTDLTDVVLDGLFLGVLSSDLVAAKMAGRELHPWLVAMCAAVVLPNLQFALMVFIGLYYVSVFSELTWYMNLPMFTVCKNVYCDGIYDLCHVGHKNLFKRALKHGNRLYVGVVGDKDANNYKRPPIMSCAERCAEVEACKAVTKVIPDAPCFGLTEEFIRKHRIHVVCCGEEYVERFPDPKDDPYYAYPRTIGIARPLPRTEGLSTSELIKRVQAAAPADEKKTPVQKEDSVKKK